MTNEELRSYARKRGVRHYELAEALHIHETMLSKMLRYEMDADLSKKLLRLVDVIADSKERSECKKTQKMNLTMHNLLNGAVDEVIGNTGKQLATEVKKPKRKKVSEVTVANNVTDVVTEVSSEDWFAEFMGEPMQQQ